MPDRESRISGHQLDRAVRTATRAVIVAQVLSQLVSLAVLAFLYRQVAPAEFGLLGMLAPLLLLARLLASFGLNVATIQRQDLSEASLSTVFWANLTFGLAATLGTLAFGPVLAWAYDTPPLVPLSFALAPTLLLVAAASQHQALLERKLHLGQLAAARVTAQLLGGAGAVVAAWYQAGVWALVVQQYLELSILLVLVWRWESWRPERPRWSPHAASALKLGGWYSGSSLMFFCSQNLDKVLLAAVAGGTATGQAAVGMYWQAFNLMMKPVLLVTTPVTGILLPALSRAQTSPAQFQELTVRFYRMTAVVLLPSAFGLLVVARDVMHVLGGPDWAAAGWMLAALAPTLLAQGFLNIAGSVFSAAGRTDRLFLGSAVIALLMTQGFVAGIWLGEQYGGPDFGAAMGLSVAFSVVTVVVLLVPYLWFCFSVVGVSASAVVAPLQRPLLAASAMGVSCAALHRWLAGWPALPIGLRLLLVMILGVTIYGLLARRELRWLISQLHVGRA